MSMEDTIRKWRGGVGPQPRRVCVTEQLPLPSWYNEARVVYSASRLQGPPLTYFVGWVGGPVKIGTASTPMNRLAALQTGSPYRLRLWAVSGYPVHTERRLHTRFRDHRLMGEWFAWHPELEAMMAALNGARKEALAAIRQNDCGKLRNGGCE